MFTVENRIVTRSGMASFGWRIGSGYVFEKITVTSKQWCVLSNSKVIAECRSKKIAEDICTELNKEKS